jgi:glycosyltransferase involved in cell wall biosynthesis
MEFEKVDDLPKVVVVGAAPFGTSTGTGITLTSLFSGWAPDRLAQVYTMDVDPTVGTCREYYKYSSRNTPVDHGMRRLIGTRSKMTPRGASTIAAVGSPGRGSESKAAAAHRQMRAVADLSVTRIPADLREWLAEFRPDIVYSLLGSVRIMRLARRVSEICSKPLIPHFMDDWPATLYANGEILGYARRAVESSLRSVLDRSPQGFCISRAMVREYEQRYGLRFDDFANCVEDVDFASPTVSGPSRSPAFSLVMVYVGGLHLGRADQLKEIAVAAESLRPTGLDIRLAIYAPGEDLRRDAELFAGITAVRLMHPLPKEEVAGVLRDADILVHVESFDKNVQRYTQLSLSTKIPQYMAAGRPILGYGPANLASMEHLQLAGAGVVVGTPGRDGLARELAKLSCNESLRLQLGSAGYRFARTHHGRASVAAKFRATLAAVSAGDPR